MIALGALIAGAAVTAQAGTWTFTSGDLASEEASVSTVERLVSWTDIGEEWVWIAGQDYLAVPVGHYTVCSYSFALPDAAAPGAHAFSGTLTMTADNSTTAWINGLDAAHEIGHHFGFDSSSTFSLPDVLNETGVNQLYINVYNADAEPPGVNPAGLTFRMVLDYHLPPTLTVDADPIVVPEGSLATNTGTYSDPDNDAITSLLASIGLAVDGGSEDWSWSFITSDGPSDSQQVTVEITDDASGSDSVSFTLTVENVAPSLNAISDATITEGDQFADSSAFSDPGADSWTATVNYGDGAGVLPLALSGRTFELAHVYPDDGTYAVDVTVSDDDGGVNSVSCSVTVENQPPDVAALTDATVVEGDPYTASGSFTDSGEDSWLATVDYGEGSGAQPLTLQAKSFNLDHLYASDGTYIVSVTVEDDDGGVDQVSCTVTVEDYSPPVLSGYPAGSTEAGALYTFTPTVNGGREPLAYSVQGRPDWATFDTATGRLEGIAGCELLGTAYEGITIAVTDAEENSDTQEPFSIAVQDGCACYEAPRYTGDSTRQTVEAGQEIEMDLEFTGGRGNLAIRASGLPHWLKLDSESGVLSGQPGCEATGTRVNARVWVNDACGRSATTWVRIAVEDSSSCHPALAVTVSPPETIMGTSAFSAAVSGGCPGEYSFSIEGDDGGGLQIDRNGTITVSPPPCESGSYRNLRVVVEDTCGQRVSSAPFSVQYEPECTCVPLAVSPFAVSAETGAELSFAPAVSGGCPPYTLRYEGLPVWASSQSDGTIQGVVPCGQADFDVQLIVEDSRGAQVAFVLRFDVGEGSGCEPLVITSTPPTEMIQGTSFSYTPTVQGGRPPYTVSASTFHSLVNASVGRGGEVVGYVVCGLPYIQGEVTVHDSLDQSATQIVLVWPRKSCFCHQTADLEVRGAMGGRNYESGSRVYLDKGTSQLIYLHVAGNIVSETRYSWTLEGAPEWVTLQATSHQHVAKLVLQPGCASPAGRGSFVVRVSDTCGHTGTFEVAFDVLEQPSSCAMLMCYPVGQLSGSIPTVVSMSGSSHYYQGALTYSGSPHFHLRTGRILNAPPGLYVRVSGGGVIIEGTVLPEHAGVYEGVKVVAWDRCYRSTSYGPFTLTVNGPPPLIEPLVAAPDLSAPIELRTTWAGYPVQVVARLQVWADTGAPWLWTPWSNYLLVQRGTESFESRFNAPTDLQGRRIYLVLAADNRFGVKLNGSYLASGNDISRTYTFDVTSHVQPGEENLIEVSVYNDGNRENPAGFSVAVGIGP